MAKTYDYVREFKKSTPPQLIGGEQKTLRFSW